MDVWKLSFFIISVSVKWRVTFGEFWDVLLIILDTFFVIIEAIFERSKGLNLRNSNSWLYKHLLVCSDNTLFQSNGGIPTSRKCLWVKCRVVNVGTRPLWPKSKESPFLCLCLKSYFLILKRDYSDPSSLGVKTFTLFGKRQRVSRELSLLTLCRVSIKSSESPYTVLTNKVHSSMTDHYLQIKRKVGRELSH